MYNQDTILCSDISTFWGFLCIQTGVGPMVFGYEGVHCSMSHSGKERGSPLHSTATPLSGLSYLKPQQKHSDVQKPLSVVSVTFLVAVNQTESNCLMTSKTPPLRPGVRHNHREYIYVGKCDYGALDFNITTSSKGVLLLVRIESC